VVGLFVAATVVALLQYLRVRERRLLPLLALFAFQAQALSREWWDVWRDVYQASACGAGLVLLVLLSPRHPPPPVASGAPPHPGDDARDGAPPGG